MRRPVFDLHRPVTDDPAAATSVIFASPHSGRDYSFAFLAQSVLDAAQIRSSEDAFVDLLYASAPQHGAPLLTARVPRAYVDLNRAKDELDPALIEGVQRVRHNPRVHSGLGVIPRVVAAGRAIYSGKLPRSEADQRLNDVWQPYHDCLTGLMDAAKASHGEAILFDCHSMPHDAIASLMAGREDLPEVVLGDRFGDSADARIVDGAESAFRRAGFRVRRNVPFAGAYVTQVYGRPRRNQHVVQIELDRSLYMDEAGLRLREDFPQVQQRIAQVVSELVRLGRPGTLPVAAE